MHSTDPSASLTGARVLMTGATGFVGASLARRLLRSHGCEVHALVRAGGGERWRLAGVEDEIEWHTCDLLDAGDLATTVERVDPDVVFHLATYYAVDQLCVLLA